MEHPRCVTTVHTKVKDTVGKYKEAHLLLGFGSTAQYEALHEALDGLEPVLQAVHQRTGGKWLLLYGGDPARPDAPDVGLLALRLAERWGCDVMAPLLLTTEEEEEEDGGAGAAQSNRSRGSGAARSSAAGGSGGFRGSSSGVEWRSSGAAMESAAGRELPAVPPHVTHVYLMRAQYEADLEPQPAAAGPVGPSGAPSAAAPPAPAPGDHGAATSGAEEGPSGALGTVASGPRVACQASDAGTRGLLSARGKRISTDARSAEGVEDAAEGQGGGGGGGEAASAAKRRRQGEAAGAAAGEGSEARLEFVEGASVSLQTRTDADPADDSRLGACGTVIAPQTFAQAGAAAAAPAAAPPAAATDAERGERSTAGTAGDGAGQQATPTAQQGAKRWERGAIVYGGVRRGRPVGASAFYLHDELISGSPRLLASVLVAGGGGIALQELQYADSRGVPWTYVPCRARYKQHYASEYGPVHEWAMERLVRRKRQQEEQEEREGRSGQRQQQQGEEHYE